MLLIVGLDGATWDLLDPWLAAGRLPVLGRLRAHGAWGPLAATTPPATMPSWTTFMTGVNPGKHGIFDFTQLVPGTYDVRFVNATFRKAPSVWARLSGAGRRVCVLGLPGTYPPESVNGCMVSGFDTPVTTRADASFVYPPSLAPVVMGLGGFPFADFQEMHVSPRWFAMARERLLSGIATKTRLARAMLSREAWDCFMVLFGESDTVSHHFWHCADAASPRFSAALAARFGEVPLEVFEALDAAVGSLIAAVPGATVLVVSDHGFGGAGAKAVHLNRWLEAAGFQRRRETGVRVGAGAVKRMVGRAVPAAWQAPLFRMGGGRWASRFESRARFAGIDWAGTRAFSEELNYFPSVRLNVRGREAAGTVDPADYERVRDEVCAAATTLRDPEHGAPLVRRAWRREELYDGPWVSLAPDIVLDLELDRGYSYNCLPSAAAPGAPPVRRLAARELGGGKLRGMSGSHRPNGIFVLAGDAVKPGRREGVRMVDMTPTMLFACGVQPGAEFDGVTISDGVGTEVFEADSQGTASVEPYSPAEERELEDRLRALGYLG